MRTLKYLSVLLLLIVVLTQAEIIWQPKQAHAAFTIFGYSLVANHDELLFERQSILDAQTCVGYSDQTDEQVCKCLDFYGVSETEFNNASF